MLLPLLAAGFSAGACGRGLFGISSAENRDAGGGDLAPDVNAVPAGLSVCFPDHPSFCNQTCRQATRVLWENCASCHGNGDYAIGLPPWDFVMDPQRLTTELWHREGQPPIHFVLPGDPANSAVYQRAVIKRDMPPLIDVNGPYYPRVTPADGQILNDWIAGCLGADPVDASSPPPPVDAGTDAFLRHAGPVACPADPSAGSSCPVNHQNCLYPTRSCLCVDGSWECLRCPSDQAGINSLCATTGNLDGAAWALLCNFGNVTCSCDHRDGLTSSGCGACPAARPADGTACGTASFSCAYGSDTCSCSGNSWSCLSGLECPEPVTTYGYGPPWVQCRGLTACDYPSLGQACACTPVGHWDCSCPPALPTEGSACAPVFSSPACSYGDQSCNCSGSNGWHCAAACPTGRPVAGDACNSTLSCTYDGGLCYCDGSHWQCS